MFSLTIEMIKWGVIYPIVIIVLAIFISLVLQTHINREVKADEIEFVLAKNYFTAKFSDDGVIGEENFDSFSEYSEDYFGTQVRMAGKEYYSNFNLYKDSQLCGIKNSPFKCSRTFTDFYLNSSKIEKAEIKMVMKRE